MNAYHHWEAGTRHQASLIFVEYASEAQCCPIQHLLWMYKVQCPRLVSPSCPGLLSCYVSRLLTPQEWLRDRALPILAAESKRFPNVVHRFITDVTASHPLWMERA